MDFFLFLVDTLISTKKWILLVTPRKKKVKKGCFGKCVVSNSNLKSERKITRSRKSHRLDLAPYAKLGDGFMRVLFMKDAR